MLTNINFFYITLIKIILIHKSVIQSFKHNVIGCWLHFWAMVTPSRNRKSARCTLDGRCDRERCEWVKMIFSWPGVGVWSGEAWWHDHLHWYSACPAPAAHWHSYTLGWRCEYKIWYRTKLSSVSVEQCPCNNTCRLKLPSWMLRLVFRRFSGMEKLTN